MGQDRDTGIKGMPWVICVVAGHAKNACACQGTEMLVCGVGRTQREQRVAVGAGPGMPTAMNKVVTVDSGWVYGVHRCTISPTDWRGHMHQQVPARPPASQCTSLSVK